MVPGGETGDDGGCSDGSGGVDAGADTGAGEDVDMRHCVLVGPSVGWEGSDFESCGSVLETRRWNGISRGTPSTISISSSPSSSCSSTSSLFPLRARRRRFFFCGLVGVCGRRFSFRRYGEGELLSLASEVTRECFAGGGERTTSILEELSLKVSTCLLPLN